MSDTTEPRDNSDQDSTRPLNDSAEMRDAIRSIGAIGEDRTGADDPNDSTDTAADAPEDAS
jgi:hypothetical protein